MLQNLERGAEHPDMAEDLAELLSTSNTEPSLASKSTDLVVLPTFAAPGGGLGGWQDKYKPRFGPYCGKRWRVGARSLPRLGDRGPVERLGGRQYSLSNANRDSGERTELHYSDWQLNP